MSVVDRDADAKALPAAEAGQKTPACQSAFDPIPSHSPDAHNRERRL